MTHSRYLAFAASSVLLIAAAAGAVTLDEPGSYAVQHTWSGVSLGIPGPLGGLFFSSDGTVLYVVGDSEESGSGLYAVPVTRDPATRAVTDLGPAAGVAKVLDGSQTGLDAGWETGPAGTLFYTYWSANYIGQRPGGVAGMETVFAMADIGVPSSVAGLTFSPHFIDPGTGFGQMQISTWSSGGQRDIYDIALAPAGSGVFTPTGRTLFVRLPQEGTGAIQYVPSGPLAGDLMYVNWDYGEVRVLAVDDATGLPIDQGTMLPERGTATPVDTRFAHDLGVGPWGLEFDPRTNDFFVGTWEGAPYDSIIHIAGPGFPPPTTTTTTPATTTTTLPGRELCGNCLDDDGDGLVDVEDPACCGGVAPSPLQLQRVQIAPRPRGDGTRLAVKARTGGLGLVRPPSAADVALVVRAAAALAPYCARMPADRVTATKTGLRFKDRKGLVSSAQGISQLKMLVRKDGQVRLAVRGTRTRLGTIPPGTLHVTVAVVPPPETQARCTRATVTLRGRRRGAVRYP